MLLEVVYSNLANNWASRDPDDIQCSLPVWQSLLWSLWMLYASTLAKMDWEDIEAPTACRLASPLTLYLGCGDCPIRSVESRVGHCGSLLGKRTRVSRVTGEGDAHGSNKDSSLGNL